MRKDAKQEDEKRIDINRRDVMKAAGGAVVAGGTLGAVSGTAVAQTSCLTDCQTINIETFNSANYRTYNLDCGGSFTVNDAGKGCISISTGSNTCMKRVRLKGGQEEVTFTCPEVNTQSEFCLPVREQGGRPDISNATFEACCLSSTFVNSFDLSCSGVSFSACACPGSTASLTVADATGTLVNQTYTADCEGVVSGSESFDATGATTATLTLRGEAFTEGPINCGDGGDGGGDGKPGEIGENVEVNVDASGGSAAESTASAENDVTVNQAANQRNDGRQATTTEAKATETTSTAGSRTLKDYLNGLLFD
ncbi:twin-arginine translocation signal domain-containing protein [Natrinema sp. HArc-T2]|uniref:twin-arginine translocation signal domain-containing protein n=1 Tax=Natrinema sp. HArc-T2 TaxID=3242701 RepID=UPI00359CD1EE